MLGERDKVTITDFGLAKQKQENKIVKSEPYGEKADVWAAGCVLYQTVTLTPPFYSANMLSLATKIVEAVYDPVEDNTVSERLTDMIKWTHSCWLLIRCLTPNADVRPDIIESVGLKEQDGQDQSQTQGFESSTSVLASGAELKQSQGDGLHLIPEHISARGFWRPVSH
ncbi:hypothetical protein PO909_008791 [Leuciscus waleckii]